MSTRTWWRDALVAVVTAAVLALAGAPAAGAADGDGTDPAATASISGTIVFPEGLQEGYSEGFDIQAWTVDGQEPWTYGSTSGSGTSFSIPGLRADQDYVVSLSFWHDELADGLWAGPGVPPVRAVAAAVAVRGGTTDLVVEALKKASPTSISGTLTLPPEVASVDGTRVVATVGLADYEGEDAVRTAVVTGSAFTLTGLNPSLGYRVCLEASASTTAGCYRSDDGTLGPVTDADSGAPAGTWVDPGSEGIVLRPHHPMSISGRVELPPGVTSLAGLTVQAVGLSWWDEPFQGSTTLTGSSTTFTIAGLSSWETYDLSITGSDKVFPGYYVSDTQPLGHQKSDASRVAPGATGLVLRPTATATPLTPTNTTRPTVLGTAKVGARLTAKPGGWSVAGLAYTYQWLRGTAAISGATTSTYTVTTADAGQKLSVRVTASRSGYQSAQATSAATATVPLLVVTSTSRPTTSGAAKVGATLTARPGSWSVSGLTTTYQWLRDGAAISGATSASYRVTASDVGRKLAVKVTVRRTGYKAASSTSAATAPVAKGTIAVRTKPTAAGSAKVGAVLTAKPGTWSASGVTLRYQWLRAGKPVPGATKATYTVAAADLGQRLSVRVTAVRSGYTSASATSASTAAVARGTLTSTARPTVTGTAAVASRLTATPGTWATTGLTYGYQWLRSGSAITGATASTYTPTAADVGKPLSVRVTARKSGYTTATATSLATAAVVKAAPAVTVTLTPSSAPAGTTVTAGVAVVVPGVTRPTGTVTVTAGGTTTTATIASTAGGRATVALPTLDAGTYDVVAQFTPTGTTATTTAAGSSAPAQLVVAPPAVP
ncbi:hypothetical protein [Cellulomonas olei]|uniref:hypothetical protein n=1 Tax=Cellulomonas sp. P4 TaxID=3142533 RepID=UPI0031BB326D